MLLIVECDYFWKSCCTARKIVKYTDTDTDTDTDTILEIIIIFSIIVWMLKLRESIDSCDWSSLKSHRTFDAQIILSEIGYYWRNG